MRLTVIDSNETLRENREDKIKLTAFEAHLVPFQSTGYALLSGVDRLSALRALGLFYWLVRHFVGLYWNAENTKVYVSYNFFKYYICFSLNYSMMYVWNGIKHYSL